MSELQRVGILGAHRMLVQMYTGLPKDCVGIIQAAQLRRRGWGSACSNEALTSITWEKALTATNTCLVR